MMFKNVNKQADTFRVCRIIFTILRRQPFSIYINPQKLNRKYFLWRIIPHVCLEMFQTAVHEYLYTIQ